MALAKKCDRCGKLHEYYPVGNQPGVYNAINKCRLGLCGTIKYEDVTIDMCPDCMASFEKFMEEGKNDG